jgi:hypothetical protein
MPRSIALDRLRAVALLLMLVHHVTGWLHGDPRGVLPGWDGFAVTDLAAPAFTVAAGASGVLLAEAMRRKGRPVVLTVLRRYGLLLPIGAALHWVLFDASRGWGVLHVLGAAVVVSTLVARRLPVPVVATLAGAAVVVGPRIVEIAPDHVVLGVGFPLVTYLGFALVGAAGARLLAEGGSDRAAEALLLGGLLTLVVAATTAAGIPPDRHPGTFRGFVVPGLAGTFLLYGAAARVRVPAVVDGLLCEAARHTFGIFLGHYAIWWCLDRSGLLPQLDAVPAIAVAVLVTVAITWASAYVPPLPWSPRTGRRRQAPKTSASTSGTGRSSWS